MLLGVVVFRVVKQIDVSYPLRPPHTFNLDGDVSSTDCYCDVNITCVF